MVSHSYSILYEWLTMQYNSDILNLVVYHETLSDKTEHSYNCNYSLHIP